MPALRFSRNTALLTILLATIWFAIPKATVAQDRAKVNKLLAKLTDNLPDSTRYLYLSRLAAQYWYTNMDTALLYANKALLVAKQSRSEALLAKAYQLFGSIYSDFDPGKAIGYIYKALPMCERLGNEQGIMICYNDLGLCFMVLDKKEQAEQMFDKALVYAYKLRRTYHVSYLVGNKGRMQFEQNKYDSAMLCFRLACKLDLQNVDSLSYGQNLINIGSVYAAQN
ncbi:MAG: hypothetical protein RIS47_669, partial [Bacteroidota bacterium]